MQEGIEDLAFDPRKGGLQAHVIDQTDIINTTRHMYHNVGPPTAHGWEDAAEYVKRRQKGFRTARKRRRAVPLSIPAEMWILLLTARETPSSRQVGLGGLSTYYCWWLGYALGTAFTGTHTECYTYQLPKLNGKKITLSIRFLHGMLFGKLWIRVARPPIKIVPAHEYGFLRHRSHDGGHQSYRRVELEDEGELHRYD